MRITDIALLTQERDNLLNYFREKKINRLDSTIVMSEAIKEITFNVTNEQIKQRLKEWQEMQEMD